MLMLKGSVTFGAGRPFVPRQLPLGPGSLMLSRRNDILSFQIRVAMVRGQVLPKMIIDVGTAKLLLTDARVIEVRGGAAGSETLSINFTKVEFTSVHFQREDPGEPGQVHYDIGGSDQV